MKFLVYLLLFNLISVSSMAQFSSWSSRQGPASLRQKQDNNYRDVWSLSDYFETQRKHRLMDQWLAMNSSSNPFEFYLGAQTTTYDAIVKENGVVGAEKEYRMNRAQVGAYASIIGLEGEYADSGEEYTSGEGSIHLRLLGRNSQGTNLTGFYGIRYKKDEALTTSEEKFQQNFYGGSLTLNLTKFFGIIGTYKKYEKDKSDIGSELESERMEGTFFIDFRFVRVYGTYFQEKEDYTNIVIPVTKEIERDGIFGGLKIFF
ncbi:MAG: hypothetical protein V4596_08610 [Bdellovibrionota bacterium]